MAHLNINGLLSKLDFIKIMLSESKFDIFAISESKLDASIHDNEIKIDGYDFYRLDRNRHGGGVLFYVNEQLESHPLKHLSGISDHSLVYVIRKFKRPKSEPKLIKTPHSSTPSKIWCLILWRIIF